MASSQPTTGISIITRTYSDHSPLTGGRSAKSSARPQASNSESVP
ncbi:hypothetical protein [Kitasatospora paracochleata]|nr:hypothetical protein [Kitasatospora paracochleata]